MQTIASKHYTIATVVKVLAGNAWFERMEEGVKKFGQETGHQTFVLGPEKADERLQSQIIKDLIERGVDAICIVPISPQALESHLNEARNKGIVVISHEASTQRNADYDIEAFDNAEYGARLMDHLACSMHEEGGYVMLVGTLTGKSHTEWSRSALKRQGSRYPKMRMLSKKLEDHDSQQIAYEQTRTLLKKYPNLRGILGCAMSSVPGAAQAVEEAGLCENMSIVGTSLPSVNRKYLLNGPVKHLCFWDPADAGYVMNALAVMVLEGKTISDGMDLGVPGYENVRMDGTILYGAAWIDVTRENMAQYAF